MQVPASVAFLQPNFRLCHSLTKLLEIGLARRLHIGGILGRMRLLNKVWLSPERASADLMIKLSKRMLRNNVPCLNLTFHSTSLKSGLSPFVANKEEETFFLKRIEDFLTFAVDFGLKPMTLAQFETCI